MTELCDAAASYGMQDFHQVRAWESAVLVAVKARKIAECIARLIASNASATTVNP